MDEKLYSFEQLALGTGRFEMEITARQGDMHYASLIGVDEAEAFRLFDAAEIRACEPASTSVRHIGLLDSLGDRVGEHWLLRAPSSDADRRAWKRLLKSDQVLVFSAPSDEWLRELVKQLQSPSVAVFPSMSLTEGWLSFEKEVFSQSANGVHVSIGAGRADVTFVGVGTLFESAVGFASLRPPLVWGYPPRAYRETLSSRSLIFS